MDDLTPAEKGLIVMANRFGSFEAMLVHPDSRAAIQDALECLDEATVASWETKMSPPEVGPPMERWMSRASSPPEAMQLPEWARNLLKFEDRHALVSAWIVALTDDNPRTAVRISKRHGESFVQLARGIDLPHAAKHACKSVFSRVGESPEERGRAVILMGCGARWRRAAENYGYRELAAVACRGRFSASAPAIKRGILALAKELEW